MGGREDIKQEESKRSSEVFSMMERVYGRVE